MAQIKHTHESFQDCVDAGLIRFEWQWPNKTTVVRFWFIPWLIHGMKPLQTRKQSWEMEEEIQESSPAQVYVVHKQIRLLANSRGHYGEEEDKECFSEWSCWIPSSGMSTSSLPCSHLSQVTRSLRHPWNVVARWRWRSRAFLHSLRSLESAQLSSLPTLRGSMFFEGIQIALKFRRRGLAYRSAIGSAFSHIPLNQ